MGFDRNRGASYLEQAKKNKIKNDEKLARKKRRDDCSAGAGNLDVEDLSGDNWGENQPDVSDPESGGELDGCGFDLEAIYGNPGMEDEEGSDDICCCRSIERDEKEQ